MYKEDLLNLLGFSHSTNVSEDTFSVFCTNIHPWGSVDEMKTAPGSFLAEHLGHWNSEIWFLPSPHALFNQGLDCITGTGISKYGIPYPDDGNHDRVDEIAKQQSSKISAVDDVAGLQKVLELSSVAECKCPPEGNDNRRNDQIKQLLLTQNALLETMFQVGRYQQVVRVGKLLLSSNRDIFGETSLEIVVIGSRLAEAVCLTNKYAEAETLAQNILTQSISLNGPKSEMSQFIIKIIAKSLRGMERHDEALNFCEQFVDLRDDEPISHDIESLRATINSLELANVFGIRNQQDIIAKCLKIRAVLNSLAEAHDRGRQLLGQCALILGNGYSKVARQELAVEEFRRAWQIYRKELGDCHPETLYCLAHLASALTRSGDYEESEQCHREADKLLSAALEIDNSATLSNSFSWGSCLWEQKKLDQAAEKYRYTYDGSIRVLGIESPNTLTAMQGLAFVLCDKGLEAQARDIVRQHFKGFREQFTEAQLKEKIEETLKGHIDES
ncbi:hypothetical protein DL95DRAFT_457438 [Leptodontidium sp. 2 PMI_412]|nr:hypothetical protein DL95DRAFT_457438 [Leptodontidium sp. 2 PMI_412]